MNKWLVCYFLFIFSCNTTSELYLIKENDRWGYIDRKGKIIIEPKYENCCYQRYEDSCCSRIIWPESLGIVKKEGKYGAIDSKGKTKINHNFAFLDQYYNSLVIARSGNLFGVLNNYGDTIFPFIFDNQFISCNNWVGHGQIDGAYYLLNFNNGLKTKTDFDKISYFTEGLAAVKKNGKYGFINEKGKLVIDAEYQSTWPFNNGMAAVKQNYQWGFIDTIGKFVIEPQFDETEGFDLFTGEYAIVVKNRKYGIIDRAGKYFIPPKYEYLYFEDNDVLLVSTYENEQHKKGVINLKGKWLYVSDNANFDYYAGFIKFERNDKFGLLKLNNKKIIIPAIFEDIAFRSKGLTLLTYYDENNESLHFSYVNKKGKVIWSENEFDITAKIKSALKD